MTKKVIFERHAAIQPVLVSRGYVVGQDRSLEVLRPRYQDKTASR